MAQSQAGVIWKVAKKSFISLTALAISIWGYVYIKAYIIPTLSEQFQTNAEKYTRTILVISIAFIIQIVLGATLIWYKENIAARTATDLDDKLVVIFHRTIKVIIWVVAALVILPFFGINISALVAALGVSSLAIALAAQDTIANVIAGFLILVDAPFKVGDTIKIPSGEKVVVLNIGLRRSRFSSDEGAIVIVPNLDLSKSKIVNYTYGK